MAKFAIFFVAALAFAGALAAPKKTQGGGAAPQKTQIEEVASQVQSVVQDVSNKLHEALPDSKQVTDALATQSQEFAHNVENIVKKLQAQIDAHKDTADDVLKQVTAKLSENVQALKQSVGPDATAKVNQIRTELDNHFKNAAAEVEKLVKVVQPNLEHAGETMNTFAKGILDDFLKAAEDLKTQVEHTVQPSTRSQRKQH